MNQRARIVDQGRDEGRAPREWIGAAEATKLLGVKRETLYAYASRGLVCSAAGAGPRERVYNRADVDRLRARSRARAGHGAVAASALRWGEPVLETSVGAITPQGPAYRGRPAVELARQGASFESVCALLWGASAAPDAALARRLGVPVASLRALLRAGAEPFDGLLLAAGALAAADQVAEPSLDVARARAPALVRRLVAACGLVEGADAVTASLEAEGAARALLVALGGRTTAPAVAAMNEALIVVADHELNPSTFAARVAASAGSSLPACMLAALAALCGPLHGGVTAHIEALVAEVERPERGAAVVGERLLQGGSVPGFGHPLYRDGDPRGARLLEAALRLGSKSRAVRVLVSVIDAMALVARERPTVDVGLVALSAALGLPRGAPLAIFACGRAAGWIAHALEQRAAGFVLRPRARYVGA
ncbi:MAG: MerR family transcriptional regulator [Polyangiaceae bacterium]|nr:MerR family transcriptional regulator [Polyangiaceae bacterium]